MSANTPHPQDEVQTHDLPAFLRACADEDVKVQPFVLRNVADLIDRLDLRVHHQTHARIHAELAIEDALDKLDSGKYFDAYDVLERALKNGRRDT